MTMQSPMIRATMWLCCLGAALAFVPSANATVVVWLDPAEPLIASVGGTVEVDLWANFSEPMMGWGLDLAFSNPAVTAAPTVDLGSSWDQPGGTLDGDGLGGLRFGTAVSGDVLLATLTFMGMDEGTTGLILGYNDDNDEGFLLDTLGMDTDITYMPATLTVIPEPTTCVLFGAVALLALRRRR